MLILLNILLVIVCFLGQFFEVIKLMKNAGIK